MQSTGPSAPLFQTPPHLGRYTVLARLGAGGMAEVLLGNLEGAAGFGRYVAIKRLLPHFAGDSELATMFVDEGRVLARIRHPNIVAVEDLVDDGQNVRADEAAMPFANGLSTTEYVIALGLIAIAGWLTWRTFGDHVDFGVRSSATVMLEDD